MQRHLMVTVVKAGDRKIKDLNGSPMEEPVAYQLVGGVMAYQDNDG